MIEDFTAYRNDNAEFKTDICIIGAGAAGITLARALLKSGHDITLLESGGTDYEAEIQDLAKGKNQGFEYYDLRESRLRFFGGTTAIWGGRSSQFDAIDFEKRDWIPHSGWPITKQDLEPYYKKAQSALDLEQIPDNKLPGFKSPFDANTLATAFWQFDEKFDRFTLGNCNDLKTAENVKILLHATAVKIAETKNKTAIDYIEIANLQGTRARVSAKHFILAAGGLEIPRLMLANNIGNQNDQVGRYFMEHPHARAGQIFLKNAKSFFKNLPAFKRYKGQRYGLLFRPGEKFQAEHKILNTSFTIAIRRHRGESQALYKTVYNTMRHDLSPTKLGRSLWKAVKGATRWIEEHLGPQILAHNLNASHNGLYAVMRAEQAPNPNSRILLSDEKDALGIPHIKLDWHFSDLDKHSTAAAMQGLDKELKRLDLGHVEPASWLGDNNILWDIDPLIGNHHIGGYHHIGTTRMGNDPKSSVVDKDCRVHGLKNLYIAGSSVFPTSGWANPTLTIIALALRLADTLSNT